MRSQWINLNRLAPLKWVVLIIVTWWPAITPGQTSDIDSLRSLVDSSKEDSVQVNILNQLGYVVLNQDPQETIRLGLTASEMAERLDYGKGMAYAFKNIGLGYYYQGDYLKVLDYWTQSLANFETINDSSQIANTLSNIGAAYFTVGNTTKAIEYYLNSLRISERIQDTTLIVKAMANVAGQYSDNEKDYHKALNYFWRVGKLAQSFPVDDVILGGYLTGIGELYSNLGNYDSALYYLERSVPIYENTVKIPETFIRIGMVHMEKGDLPTAVEYLENAYLKAKQSGYDLYITSALIKLGDTYQALGQMKEAFEAYREAESVALNSGLTYELRDVYKGLAQTYAKEGSFKNAYKYENQYQTLKDSLFNLETDDKVRGLQFTYEIDKKQDQINLLEKDSEIAQLQARRQKAISQAAGVVGFLLLLLAIGLFKRYQFIRRTKRIIENEKQKSENLLLNILPEETAEELKINGTAKARSYQSVSILFTDFKGFTSIAANLSPEQLVQEIHEQYKVFDEIMSHHGIEKIKTIGDAYMAAGGLPVPNDTNAMDVVKAALEIRDYMLRLKQAREAEGKPCFEIRIGVHTGPVVAGIVGIKKFAYDIWGDTVNIASRMESNSEPGKVNISQTTYDLVKDFTSCIYRGEIDAKNRGKLKMYFVNDLSIPVQTSVAAADLGEQ